MERDTFNTLGVSERAKQLGLNRNVLGILLLVSSILSSSLHLFWAHAGSFKLSVAMEIYQVSHRRLSRRGIYQYVGTFKVEQNIRLIVLEHLSDQLNIHVLNIDILVQSVRRQTFKFWNC
jgi:hypothetical protein